MNIQNLDAKLIKEKIFLIDKHVKRLTGFQTLSENELAQDINFDAAAWNLRSALETTFAICAHILSRIPGVRVDEYKQMALEMGRQSIVPMDFAEQKLQKMAGYRNRLTHFYFEVTPREMYDIIQNHLDDFSTCLKHVSKLL